MIFPLVNAESKKSDSIKLVHVKAGQFTMGSNRGEKDERPVHLVYLDGYWIGKYEVTNKEYKTFLLKTGYPEPKAINDTPINPSDRHPVIGVSWKDAMNFAGWLSVKTGRKFRLPTEAEWEKAARGIKKRIFPWGNDPPGNANIRANYVVEEDGFIFSAPVGSFKNAASPYGIYDMAGNIWEWCLDWYSPNYYKNSPLKNPKGPKTGDIHVVKGGSWVDFPYYLRISKRNSPNSSTYRYGLIGFRLAMDEKR